MANLRVVVANQQAVLAKVQMISAEFAMCWCSSVVGGGRVSDATTWTILLIYINFAKNLLQETTLDST